MNSTFLPRLRTREALLGMLRQQATVDVLIVGGGINGVGIYRDLAAQGVAAVLVDKEDFCSGTSAAPSRLVHGGLRYLETGEFALVRESVEERNRLLRNAPHLVKPLPVWVPLRQWTAGLLHAPLRFLRWSRTPGAKGALVTKLGLLVYDRFNRRIPALPPHCMVSGPSMRKAMPALAGDIRLAAQYYDARLVHPERLTLELIMDAEQECPASMALPYVSVKGLTGGAVQLQDAINNETLLLRPRLLINASGAWLDQVDASLGITRPMIGGTRGSHLVLRHATLAAQLDGRMLYFETADHRVCLVYPTGSDLLLLGTTDLRSDDPNDKQCTPAEIDYLFGVLRTLMPDLPIGPEHIVFQYAGVRPLPRSDDGATGAISRDHALHMFPATQERPFDVAALVGGKWTTYRACAAQVVDAVLPRLNRQRQRDLSNEPIGGGRDWPHDEITRQEHLTQLAASHPASAPWLEALWTRYGCATAAMLAALPSDLWQPIEGLPDHSVAEIEHIARHERVTRLSDIVLRRTLMAFEGRCNAQALSVLTDIVGRALGWSAQQRDMELADTLHLLRHRHGVRIAG